MATCKLLVLQLMLLFNSLPITAQETRVSLSFPLTVSSKATLLSSLGTNKRKVQNENENGNETTSSPPFNYNYKSSFKYSIALIVSLPIGTPPQTQSVVLDTGSQLSWIKCNRKSPKTAYFPPRTTTFDPSLSSTFSILPCNHPQCKPRTPDFTLPTTCDQNRLCHYSYFYADGTLAEGNLVREKFTFPGSRTTPPLILGCASSSSEAEGILGMNLGRLSFVSQANVPKFSYCVPLGQGRDKINPMGSFYLGENPNSRTFQYVDLLSLPESRSMPNFDPLAYTVGLVGIKIGDKRLNISKNVFRPGASGSGQTVIDSGTQYTFLVEQAYSKVREEVVRLVGSKAKKGYVYGDALDMCFEGNTVDIRRLIGDMAFEFEKGVEILINKERILAEVGEGIQCVAIGRSESLGISSNIIGNFHQQNLWVEFDVKSRRVGFNPADCSRSD